MTIKRAWMMGLLAAAASLSPAAGWAVDPPAKTDAPPTADAKAAATAAPADDVKIPDGTPRQLLDFADSALSVNPDSEDEAVIKAAFVRAFRTLVLTADKILAHPKATEDEKVEALQFKVSALSQGARMGMTGFADDLKKLVADLSAARPKSDIAALAEVLYIKARHETPQGLQPAALADVEAFLGKYPKNPVAGGLLMELAMTAEANAKDEDAKKALTVLTEKLGDSDAAKVGAGMLRRLNLLGKPVELKGKTLDGKPLDVAGLKGKVVLVDFWATWCGPCLAEMPRMKEAYDKYRDTGFEIVGIPLDDELDTVRKFVAAEKVAWLQLVSEKEGETGTEAPFATHYGVASIPRLFLIDRAGNVVSTNARGEELEALLKPLLAAPAPAK